MAHCRAAGESIPKFVQKEFEEFLRCGILAHGFARVYCEECHFDMPVPLSCKGRAFCGSCMARRMSETAAHIVDHVIPCIPTRQWVLSVPKPLRYLAHPGAITFVQRFGGAGNLNVHLHCCFSDGIFIEQDSGEVRFCRIEEPTIADILEITEKVFRRVHRWLEKRMDEYEHDALAENNSLLAACYQGSIKQMAALGPRAGLPFLRVVSELPGSTDNAREARTVAGFNLHVSRAIEDDDRAALERQLRYMGRPPFAEERLSKTKDGKIVIRFKRKWSDGTEAIIMEPLEFMQTLAALEPVSKPNSALFRVQICCISFCFSCKYARYSRRKSKRTTTNCPSK